MTENSRGGWHTYTWASGITPASPSGVLALGFVANGLPVYSAVAVDGLTAGLQFSVIDLTESEQSTDPNCIYRGGIQSVDKSFSASPILIPVPERLAVGYDIGFIESAVVTIAGVWFDGIAGRDSIMEDLRTTKKLVSPTYKQSPLVLMISDRLYPVFITGYSSNIVGGQGNIISFRLGLSICSFTGHYGYTG